MSGHSLQQNKFQILPVSRLRKLVDGLRELAGDTAYERYLEHCRQHHPETAPLDRKTFYNQRLQLKWSGINRCC